MHARLTLTLALLAGATALAAQSLAVTELMYNPPEGGVDSTEFIEIYNFGTTDVSVDNYVLSVTGSTIADTLRGTIPAGEFYVSAVNARAFETVYGRAPSSQWTGSGLSNGGNREIVLTDAGGTTVVAFTYMNSAPWPAVSNANGPSIELCNPAVDPTIGGNWNASETEVGIMVNGQVLRASPFAFTPGTCGGGTVVDYPERRLTEIRPVDANGVPVLLDSLAYVEGLVVGADLRDDGLQFTIIDTDNEAGIGVINLTEDFGIRIMERDIVRIAGRIGQFNGLTQISVDSITKLGTITELPPAATVNTLDESTESRLVRLPGVRLLDPAQWGTDPAESYNLDAITAAGDSIVVRLDGTYMIPRPADVGTTATITGVAGQFDRSRPYDSGYQLFPRSLADFDFISSVAEVPAREVFGARQRGATLEIELRQAVTEVMVTDIAGRRLASARPSGRATVALDLGGAGAGLVYISAVLPTGAQTTHALVWR